jgi:hypothetical protein
MLVKDFCWPEIMFWIVYQLWVTNRLVMKPSGYKAIIGLLGACLVVLVVLLANSRAQLTHFQNDVRLARDIIWTIHTNRDMALKAEPSEAAFFLDRIRVDPEAKPFRNPLGDVIARERRDAIAAIIRYLRLKTGKDYGDDDKEWVKALR